MASKSKFSVQQQEVYDRIKASDSDALVLNRQSIPGKYKAIIATIDGIIKEKFSKGVHAASAQEIISQLNNATALLQELTFTFDELINRENDNYFTEATNAFHCKEALEDLTTKYEGETNAIKETLVSEIGLGESSFGRKFFPPRTLKPGEREKGYTVVGKNDAQGRESGVYDPSGNKLREGGTRRNRRRGRKSRR